MTIAQLKSAIGTICPRYPLKRVTLFGSRADGTNTAQSDVDLIVEFSAPVTLLTLSQLQLELEEALGLDVDIVHGPIGEEDLLEVQQEIEVYAA